MKYLIFIICLLFFVGYQGSSQYLIPLYASGNTKDTTSNNNYTTTLVFGQNVIGLSLNTKKNINFGLLAPFVYTTRTDNFVGNSNSSFILYQNYPNPFRENTTISFDLKKHDFVKFAVYDIFGQQIKLYYNQELNPGIYSMSFNSKEISPGIYFYQIKVDNRIQTKSMILIK